MRERERGRVLESAREERSKEKEGKRERSSEKRGLLVSYMGKCMMILHRLKGDGGRERKMQEGERERRLNE